MPSTTAKLALPYPIGSDPVADGDNAIRALADRLEVLMATGTTAAAGAVAPVAPAVNQDEGVNLFKVAGGLAVLSWWIATPAIGTGGVIARVVAGYRPRQRAWFNGIVYNAGSYTSHPMGLATNGDLQVLSPLGASVIVGGTVTYAIAL